MAHTTQSWMAVLLASLAITGGANAYNVDDDPSVQEQIKAMRAEMERLHSDNAQMKTEIDDLKAAADDDWLTERRSEEIKTLVADVLADSDTRSSNLQNGLLAGWSDHFFLASPDGRFKLQLEGQMQIRWVYSYQDRTDDHRQGFENTRTKLTVRGHVFNQDMNYLVRGDFNRGNGAFSMQDAWLQYRLNNDWHVRIGLFKLPYSREELVSSTRQLAVERSLTNESFNIGRSQGVEFIYAADDWKLWIATHDGGEDNLGGFTSLAGTVGGVTTALSEDVEWALTFRYEKLLAGEWRQFQDFTSPMADEYGMLMGFAGHLQQEESVGQFGLARDETRWYAATADLSIEWGGANLFGSFNYSFNDHPSFGHFNLYGFLAQGGVYFTPKFEMFARYQYGWWDFTQDFADLHQFMLGANYYLDGHDAKWTTDIGFGIGRVESTWDSDLAGWRTETEGSDTPQIVFRTQFQLLF